MNWSHYGDQQVASLRRSRLGPIAPIIYTNGNYKAIEQEHHYRLKASSVFVIGIKDPKRGNEAMDPVVDLYLYRPFTASELKQVLKNRGKALPSF